MCGSRCSSFTAISDVRHEACLNVWFSVWQFYYKVWCETWSMSKCVILGAAVLLQRLTWSMSKCVVVCVAVLQHWLTWSMRHVRMKYYITYSCFVHHVNVTNHFGTSVMHEAMWQFLPTICQCDQPLCHLCHAWSYVVAVSTYYLSMWPTTLSPLSCMKLCGSSFYLLFVNVTNHFGTSVMHEAMW